MESLDILWFGLDCKLQHVQIHTSASSGHFICLMTLWLLGTLLWNYPQLHSIIYYSCFKQACIGIYYAYRVSQFLLVVCMEQLFVANKTKFANQKSLALVSSCFRFDFYLCFLKIECINLSTWGFLGLWVWTNGRTFSTLMSLVFLCSRKWWLCLHL